jgi:hypothetical protein
MGGRGPRFAPGASVLDPLMAGALLLEDAQGRRQLWISLDLIGLDYGRSAALRQDLAALTGVAYEAVVLNFAHVHSGPMTNFRRYPRVAPEPQLLQQYHRTLHRAVQRLAARALSNLQPVTVRLHRGSSDVGINRRRRDQDGQMTMAPNPEGVYNPDLWVLDVQATKGPGRALIFNYGCHPVIVYGFAWDGISAGYPGVARGELRARLGPDLHCQFVQGLAGNVRPRVLADRGAFRKSKPEDVEDAGRQLADDVIAAIEGEGALLDVSLEAAAGWIHPRRALDEAPDLSHWQALAEREDELSRNLGRYWARRMASIEPLSSNEPLEIGLLRLSKAEHIAWISAEAVAEWLGLLRSWLDLAKLTVWGYSQEVSGYLPTDELLTEGGYEVINANWYGVHGPAPFADGVNATVRGGFEALATCLASRR